MSEENKTLKLSDFTEEHYHSFECPYCHEISATHYGLSDEFVTCENCYEEIRVEKENGN